MSIAVTRYICDECGAFRSTAEEADRCARKNREEEARKALEKRWHAIDDERWRLTAEDMDAIDAIIARRAAPASTPTTGETEGA